MKNENELSELLKSLPSNVLDSLLGREKVILTELYGLDGNKPLSYTEVGKLHMVTRTRIMQIEAKALRKLKARKDLLSQQNLESEEQGKHL